MEILLVFLCCGSLLFTTALGVGVTLLLERFLGIWAYVAGALVPVILFTALYTLYHIYVRATPCEPVGSLSCGEPFIAAFFLFAGVAFFLLLANILAQASLYFLLYGRRQTFPAAVYENADADLGQDTGEYVGAPLPTVEEQMQQQPESVAELPADEPYTDESQWSGLPPDAPEEEPPPNRT